MLPELVPQRTRKRFIQKLSETTESLASNNVARTIGFAAEDIINFAQNTQEKIRKVKNKYDKQEQRRLIDIVVLGIHAPDINIPRQGSFSIEEGRPIDITQIRESAANELRKRLDRPTSSQNDHRIPLSRR